MGEKQRLPGVVDRVEGNTVVVVVRDPNTDTNREVYVDKRKLTRVDLKEGDKVSVEMSFMVMDEKSETVSLIFNGVKPGVMAKKFFAYLVDGGLEDILIENLSGPGALLGISGFDKKKLTVSFEIAKDKPAKKMVKKAAKKSVKKQVKAKKAVKKVFAKRGKKR
jgi:hypothetical protein